MPDDRRRPGRPALDASDPSVIVAFRLPSRDYDSLCQHAKSVRVSVADVLRRSVQALHPPDKSTE